MSDDKLPIEGNEQTADSESGGIIIESLPVPLEDDVKLELGAQIADILTDVEGKEAHLKMYSGVKKAEIKELLAQAQSLANRIKYGDKLAPVECFVKDNDPEPLKRSIYRCDTGELVRVEDSQLFPGNSFSGGSETTIEIKEGMSQEEIKEAVREAFSKRTTFKCGVCRGRYQATVEDLKAYYGNDKDHQFICPGCALDEGKKLVEEMAEGE